MPTFLLPRIRQCFATTSQTLIMHYAVNTVIIYVNTKLFKEMRGLKELVLRISSCEGVGRNCDGSCPAHTISGASPTFDNLTIHAIQWPSPETRGHRHSYNMTGHQPAVSAVRSAVVESVSAAERSADRRVWPELECPPCPGASRILVIAQLTFPETPRVRLYCDITHYNKYSVSSDSDTMTLFVNSNQIKFQKCSFYELTLKNSFL